MDDKHYELLLIKHIWILLDSYVVQTNVHKMNKAEQSDTDLCKDCSKLLDNHDEHCDLCSSDAAEREDD